MRVSTAGTLRAALFLTSLLLAVAVVCLYAGQAQAISPSGTITTSSTTITSYASDQASGLNTDSWVVTLDGVPLTGAVTYLGNDTWQSGQCTISAWEYDEWLGYAQSDISCAVTGLTSGTHAITSSIYSWWGDNYSSSGSFTVTLPPPPPPAHVTPHGGYGTGNAPDGVQTDLCLSCHDVHQAEGDYALMREATVTATCGTCHGLFGETPDGTWTETPFNLVDGDTGEATVSPTVAYENTGAARVSGHRLGVSGDTNANVSDYIPGSTLNLKVMESLEYDEGDIYDGESVTAYAATNGLYCASCHTAHGTILGIDFEAGMPAGTPGLGVADVPVPTNNYNSAGVVTSQLYFGDQLVIDDKLSSHPKNVKVEKHISSNPNHLLERSLKREASADGVACAADASAVTVGDDALIDNGMCDKFMTVDEPATTYNNWCLQCHDKQWNGTEWEGTEMHGNLVGGNNHPPLCTSCHSASGGNKGVKDYPHTSGNQKLLSKDHDGICLGCHSSGRLP